MFRTIARTEKNTRFASAVPALLLSVVVFIMAIAGTATAAKLITGKDIKNDTVTTKDIKNGSLAEKDLKSKVKAKLNAPAMSGYEVRSATAPVESGGQQLVFVACSSGKVALGGGGSWDSTDFGAVIQESSPQRVIGDFFAPADPGLADAWGITGKHDGLDPAELTAWVICVDPS